MEVNLQIVHTLRRWILGLLAILWSRLGVCQVRSASTSWGNSCSSLKFVWSSTPVGSWNRSGGTEKSDTGTDTDTDTDTQTSRKSTSNLYSIQRSSPGPGPAALPRVRAGLLEPTQRGAGLFGSANKRTLPRFVSGEVT